VQTRQEVVRQGDNNSNKSEDEASNKTSARAASMSGTITDSNGAVIPGATVLLVDEKGNEVRKGTTNDDGRYSLENIDAGSYQFAAFARGFKRHESAIRVSMGDAESRDVALDPGMIVMGGVMAVVSPEYKGDLAVAVSKDDVEGARNLIAAGRDVNGKEDDKTTPLFIAVENGNLDMIRLLLDFGAKVNARNKDKETPLMKLDEDASKDLVEALIAAGAKVNSVSKEGNTALILAAQGAKPEVVQALIDAGAEIDARNEEGETALITAANFDNFESVKALILAGANVNLKDNDGDTAWDKTSNEEIEDFLVAHGAIVEEKPEEPASGEDGEPGPPSI